MSLIAGSKVPKISGAIFLHFSRSDNEPGPRGLLKLDVGHTLQRQLIMQLVHTARHPGHDIVCVWAMAAMDQVVARCGWIMVKYGEYLKWPSYNWWIISQIMSDISVPKLWKAWFWMILASPKLLQDSQLCQQCLSIHPLRRACAWCCHMPQVSSPWPRSRASVDVAMVGRWNLGIHHGFFERKWRLPLLPLSSMNPWSKFEHL